LIKNELVRGFNGPLLLQVGGRLDVLLLLGSLGFLHVAPFLGDVFLALETRVGNVRSVNRTRIEWNGIANGQFILTPRAAYEAIGTHEAVKDTVADDLRIRGTEVSGLRDALDHVSLSDLNHKMAHHERKHDQEHLVSLIQPARTVAEGVR